MRQKACALTLVRAARVCCVCGCAAVWNSRFLLYTERQTTDTDSSTTTMSFLSSDQLKGPAWTVTGGIGGAALGVTVGGPLGAIVGCGFGIFAGTVRAVSGRSLADITSAAMPPPNSKSNGTMLPASFEKMLPPAPVNCAPAKSSGMSANNKPGC